MSKILHVYNYPVNSKDDIFDTKDESDNFFVSTNRGVSYLGKIEEFNERTISESNEFSKEIPNEDTNLYIEERLRIYFRGKCIWKNKNVVNLNEFSQGELSNSHINEFAKTATDTSNIEFNVRVVSKDESALINENYMHNTKKFHDASNEASIKSENGYTLITRVLMNINRH